MAGFRDADAFRAQRYVYLFILFYFILFYFDYTNVYLQINRLRVQAPPPLLQHQSPQRRG